MSPSRREGGRFSFVRGVLYIRLPDRELSIQGWPTLVARERRILGGSSRRFTPAFRLLREDTRSPRARTGRRKRKPPQLDLPMTLPASLSWSEERRLALAAFRSTLPHDLAAAVEPFESEQWRLMRLASEAEGALDLLCANPALAFCLALSHRFARTRPERGSAVAARWIGARQTEILGWLRFPPTRAVARILARIEPVALSAESALQLLITLRDERARRLLAHQGSINAGALELVQRPRLRELVTPVLLEAIRHDRRERDHPRCAGLLAGVLMMAEDLGRDLSRRRFRDPERIRALHDELAGAYAREHEGELLRCRFGRPPVSGTPDIVPLTSARQLIEEGRSMRNCVAGYAPRVENRRAYVYRVLRPERATLALTRATSRSWKIGELYLAGNVDVAAQTRSAVTTWLASRSLG